MRTIDLHLTTPLPFINISPDNRSCVSMSDTLVAKNESLDPLHMSGNVFMACLRI